MKEPWKDVYLLRLTDNGEETIGYLHFSDGRGAIALNTLELPWKDNKKNVSCIPTGVYAYHKDYSPKHKMTVVRIDKVPNRTDIEIHIANFVHELLGCIAVGIGKDDINGDGLIDVTKSKQALYQLLAILPEKGFIHISNAWKS